MKSGYIYFSLTLFIKAKIEQQQHQQVVNLIQLKIIYKIVVLHVTSVKLI